MPDVADKGALDSIISRQREEQYLDDDKKLLIEVKEENYVVVNKVLGMRIKYGDNIMILEDPFKSSYDCKVCNGSGKRKFNCEYCSGSGINRLGSRCTKCEGEGFTVSECQDCHGKGALLEIPDSAKSRPTSGTIVVTGPDCSIYQRGDRVAYSAYTGHLVPFNNNNRLRVMREKEPFCQLFPVGNMSIEDITKEIQFVDKDNAYDVS